ncbi:hypothetical protein ABQD64_13745 [Vagococcus fluvialis]|uniref:hypothetical protein n=1 Tax=Vagococcus fluvialis TaxID=2738 RepID=UPI0032E3D9A4
MAIPDNKIRVQFTLSEEVYLKFRDLYDLEKKKGNKDVKYTSDIVSGLIESDWDSKQEQIKDLKKIDDILKKLKND